MSARKIGKALRDMGPLVLIALLVPGGMLIAAVIYWLRQDSQHHRASRAGQLDTLEKRSRQL